jgi:RNA-directed DNA polymerase
MLAALEQVVKGGKWYSLIDKVHALPTLRAAYAQVKANAGAPARPEWIMSWSNATKDLDANLERLSDELRTGTYLPQHIRRHYIPKPGSQEKRPLGIPTVRDRVYRRRCAWGAPQKALGL